MVCFGLGRYDRCSALHLDDIDAMLLDHLTSLEGEGGMIAVDPQGNIAMPFNSEGMYRGSVNSKGELTIAIYSE